VSGGAGDMDNAVQVRTEPPLIPPPLQHLNESELVQKVHVSLYGADTAIKGVSKGFHLGPAEARCVVGVVGERAVGRDYLGWHALVNKVLDLGDPRKLLLSRHETSSKGLRRFAMW
jgi:hypothetical protein